MNKEKIYFFRYIVMPVALSWLVNDTYGSVGEQDRGDFEKDFNEILDLAQSALEDDTLFDAISREKAIDVINDGRLTKLIDADVAIDSIKRLPHVKPEQKTAFWLIRKWGDDAKCSNCGHTFKDVYDMDNHDRFCRFCGAKMIGVKGVKLIQDDINIIVSGRRSGKTTALIKECAKLNGLMVVRNRELASWIYETAKKNGYEIKEPITYDDLLKGYKLAGRRNDVLFLDDLDWFVRRICGWNPIGMVSFTGNAFLTKLELEKIRKGEG